ncbi:MAG: ATP-binding protein [Gemmatimonadaceae bacterium]
MRRARWSGLLLLALMAGGPRLAAQPESSPSAVRLLSNTVSVRRWGSEQGLPQASVTRLAVDRDGYVWGATFGGLIRFDGRSVLSLSARELPILTGNAVTAVLARPNGELWIGTPAGTVARLRNGRLVDTLPHPPMPAGGAVSDLLMDRGGTLWLQSLRDVYGYAEGRWSRQPLRFGGVSPLAHDAAGDVIVHGTDGVIRATTHGGEVLAPSVLPTALRSPAEAPVALHTDRRGRIWLGGPDGLHRVEGQRVRRITGVPGPVHVVTSDENGMLWLGIGQRLYRYHPGFDETAAVAPTAVIDAGDKVMALAVTADGALVVGTLNGLLVVRQALVTVVEAPTRANRREVNSVAADGQGRVWVASDCGVGVLLDRRGARVDSITRADRAACIRSLAHDARGRIWVGGDSAILRRDRDGRERSWRIPVTTTAPITVRPLLVIGDTLLFGLADGRLGRIGPDDSLTFPAPWRVADGRPIESIADATDGAFWVAQTGRLTLWKGARRDTFGADDGIPNTVPRALLPHPAGGVWIGTYGSGLYYFRPGARARPVPLPDQTVSALLEDGEGRLWMPGNRGLTVVAMASLRRWLLDSLAAPGARLLSSSAGVPEGTFGAPAAAVIAPRLLAFASVAGLTVVETSRVTTPMASPRVQVDAIRTARRTLTPADGRVVVAPDDRVVQVEYSAPAFQATEATEFRYRLDGRDRQWIPLATNRDVRLVGLPPGRYTLHLEGRVAEGAWGAAAPLTLVVEPWFVERVWWRVALVVLVVAMATQYARQRVRAAEAEARVREVALQALQAQQRSAALQEQHQRELAQVSRVAVAGELTASLSHELGQPLAAIVNNAEVARRLLTRATSAAGAADPRLAEALHDVVAQGQRASEVVRAFRGFLRREQGERERLRVRDLLESVSLLLGREYRDAGVALTLSVDPSVPMVYGERVLLQQVFVNLLQNALQATGSVATGPVLVRARGAAGGVRVSVVDSGPGIAAEVRRTLFEPFVTSRRGGLGMGLPIARRVVEAHGGHMGVGRLPGGGAVLSVWLPAAKALTSGAGVSSLP